jgi:hypothetical protein
MTAVAGQLEFLRGRGDARRDVLAANAVCVTVSREFATAMKSLWCRRARDCYQVLLIIP